MTSFSSGSFSLIIFAGSAAALPANIILVVSLTLGITIFLCLLNIMFALFFRKRQKKEVLSYCAACIVELAIFVVALLVYIGVIATMPFHLPPGLPVNQAEISAALAIGIGLFPAAYWHSVKLSDLPSRIAEDGRTMKEHQATVRDISHHGEWMN